MFSIFRQNLDACAVGQIQSESEFNSKLFWSGARVTNPDFMSVIQHPTLPGKCLQQKAPAHEYNVANSSIHAFYPLNKLGVLSDKVELSYKIYFQASDTAGKLITGIRATETRSLTLKLTSGNIKNIVRNGSMHGIKTRSFAGELFVRVGTKEETIKYKTATPVAGGCMRFDGLTRSQRGTEARFWAKGTEFRVAYDFCRGHKLPGFKSGDKGNADKTTSGRTYATCRTYQTGYNGDAGYLGIYLYHADKAMEMNTAGDAKYAPRGYTKGPVFFKHETWHAVRMVATLGDKGKHNGTVDVYFDDVHVYRRHNIMFRASSSTEVLKTWTWFNYASHWGGSDMSCATTKEEFKLFSDFIIKVG